MKTKKNCFLTILEVLRQKICHPQPIPVAEYEDGNRFFCLWNQWFLSIFDRFCIRNISIANVNRYSKCSICNKIMSWEYLSSKMNDTAIRFFCNSYIYRNIESL